MQDLTMGPCSLRGGACQAEGHRLHTGGWARLGDRGGRGPECQELGLGPPQSPTKEQGGQWRGRVTSS